MGTSRTSNATRERISRHVSCLQQITGMLLPAQRIEGTLPAVFAALTTTLPTSTAVLITEQEGELRTHLWRTPDVTPHWEQVATAHARTLFAYLIDHDHAPEVVEPTMFHTLPTTVKRLGREGQYVALPLAVGGILGALHVFGALQIQGVAPIDLLDLALIGAVSTVLALAFFRQQAWEGDGENAARLRYCQPN